MINDLCKHSAVRLSILLGPRDGVWGPEMGKLTSLLLVALFVMVFPGLSSAVVDNVPLVEAVEDVQPPRKA